MNSLRKLNIRFLISLSLLIFLCVNRDLKNYFPIFLSLLIFFLPYPLEKRYLKSIYSIIRPLIYLITIFIFFNLIAFFLYQSYNLKFAIRPSIYLITFILLTYYFFFWFQKLKSYLINNLIICLLITEILNIIFFNYLYFFSLRNFTLFHLLLFFLILSISHYKNSKNILFFLIFFYFLLAIEQGSSQTSLLIMGSLGLFLFLKKVNVKTSVNTIYLVILTYPLIFILFLYFFPSLNVIDKNINFRFDAIIYNLSLIFTDIVQYFRLDRPLHPYLIDRFQDEITDSQRNVSTHNAIIDIYSRTTIIGFLFFINFIKQIKNTILKINFDNLSKNITIYLWLYFGIHLSLNQIYKFDGIAIMAFIMGYILYSRLQD